MISVGPMTFTAHGLMWRLWDELCRVEQESKDKKKYEPITKLKLEIGEESFNYITVEQNGRKFYVIVAEVASGIKDK
jgi:hypothetical protein